jgi:predicted GNAT family N-acyltransferase
MIVRAAGDPEEVRAALELRRRVFCGEQGVSPAVERDGRDAEALHVVALADGDLLGTCRVLVEAQAARLGRMAVAPGARGRGIGTEILLEAEQLARAAGARRMTLHAQVEARGVYDRAGYEQRSATFVEAGIEHVAMEKALA